ncbi:hypothetical protein EJ04DRAFT_521595 [Polyplosphaeria fusca]|uniref:Uncharacterized protein n=1 Tax=Polyplosphaeria fusca TaxID=682080 RepID=A0A9P4R0H3_9PLEO|nr:hypothetical protein EJ04DRAFT_521595 [Polyplosphaeria fusca]
MRTTIIFSLLSASALAFDLKFYSSSQCDGELPPFGNGSATLRLEDGCRKFDRGNVAAQQSLMINWNADSDNEQVIAVFDNENCCNGGASEFGSQGWSTDCLDLLVTWKSYRVMDPNDINLGKEGEKYECRNSPDE